MQQLERSIAVYGMINVRTDGEKAIVAQKLERRRRVGKGVISNSSSRLY
jgi:hypothetical protein